MEDHLAYASYDGDPAFDSRVAQDDADRRILAQHYQPRLVDAIMRGETLDANATIIANAHSMESYGSYDAGNVVLGEFDSMSIEQIDAEATAEPEDKFAGIHDVMRKKIQIKGGSRNPKRRQDPAKMLRPTSLQAFNLLRTDRRGRPRKGEQPRITISTRIDTDSREIYLNMGESMGDALDTVARALQNGITLAKLNEIVDNMGNCDTMGV